MSSFGVAIRPFVDRELEQAADAELAGEPSRAFECLERAHVLGQASTREHLRVHWAMLRWAMRQGAAREFVGQVLRLIGAGSATAFGLVPIGNTGGSNISAFRRLPISEDLQSILDAARARE